MGKKKPTGGTSRKKDRKIYPLGAAETPAAPPPSTAALERNGLQKFSFHSGDSDVRSHDLLPPFAMAGEGDADLSHLSTETAARYYLEGSLASPRLPAFTADEVNGEKPEFKSLGAEKLPLTGTQTVKFRQMYRKIPVYGSLVTVELDEKNKLVSINSSMGDPANVNPVASISPAQALARVKDLAGYKTAPLDATPRLLYYFDQPQARWRLVYVVEDVVKQSAPSSDANGAHGHDPLPPVVDYVIDAHTNELVKEVSRVPTAAISKKALDGLSVSRTISVFQIDGQPILRMQDPGLNVQTHDFGFRSIRLQYTSLPGQLILNPPDPWDPGAVSAHFNACVVADFLRKVLMRNGIDNQGGTLRSSINCLDRLTPNKVWRNAAWFLGQMVYGQQKVGNALRSLAVGLDVVAHEIFHGVTDKTARLEYESMSGALNESYSDIFGSIISNYDKNDIGTWEWQMGEDLDGTGVPLRDMARPGRFGQPEHMNQFMTATPPYDENNDYGHVHSNSGIHNKAAYLLITSKGANGKFLFDKKSVAILFYLALTQHLTRNSTFRDSRRAVELVARTLFRNDSASVRQPRLQAVSAAFEKVGITAS